MSEQKIENETLSYSYHVRFVAPETVQALEATGDAADYGSLWHALLTQYQYRQKYTLRDIQKQNIKIEMKPSKCLESNQGRAQQLMDRLIIADYTIPDVHRWVKVTNVLLEVYKTSVRLINMTFEEITYQELTN